jgi:hypothetical protein
MKPESLPLARAARTVATDGADPGSVGRWSRWWVESRTLMLGASLMLLAMLATWAWSLRDPQTFHGVDAYLKPLKFELSLAVYLLCLAWMRSYLTTQGRQRRLAVFTSAVPTAAACAEVLYIVWRAAHGEASHFNQDSVLAAVAYGLMGLGALLLVFASGVLAWLMQRHAVAGLNAAWLSSLRSALWLTMILGGLAGIYLSAQSGHWVGGAATDVAGLPLTGWSRTGGDLRVPHFLGIHAMQLLPFAGWCLACRWPVPRALHAVRAVAVIYTVLTLATFVQAVAGVPLLFGW